MAGADCTTDTRVMAAHQEEHARCGGLTRELLKLSSAKKESPWSQECALEIL